MTTATKPILTTGEQAAMPCWIWGAGKTSAGYGEMVIDGKPYYAHRYVYEAFVGEIPEGYVIDHLCRNPSCVNPEHLEAVTNAENTRRGDKAKLTARDVIEIRAASGKRSEIGTRYGISPGYVTAIKAGRRWTDIEGDVISLAPGSRTHCPSGHPYDEANTHYSKDGHRTCRACNRKRVAERRAKYGR